MVVKTLFHVGEKVIADVEGVLYESIIDSININIRTINNINVKTIRYCLNYKTCNYICIKRIILTEDKLTKIK